MLRARRGLFLGLAVSAFGLAQACSCSDTGDTATNQHGTGGHGGSGGNAGDASNDGLVFPDGNTGGGTGTCDGGCPEGMICINGFCVTQTACTDDNDCQNDTYCQPGTGCVPWGQPPTKTSDPTCQVGLPPGNLAPKVKCELTPPPAGDPFPNHKDVQATPVVVNFNAGGTGVPSIVAPFTATVVGAYTEDQGIIRVLRGDTCQLEANLGGGQAGYNGFLVSSGAVAVGDLDGDKSAEIVANAADGTMVAFTRKAGTWSTLWVSAAAIVQACTGNCPLGWAGPSIHDLDDDGVPEIIREGTVVNGATGAIKGQPPAGYASYSQGLNPVLANLDQDPAIELTNGQYVWEWTSSGWSQEAYFPGATPSAPGFVAVADFGAYGATAPANNPEIAVVRSAFAMIYAIDGTLVLGPIAVPGGGGGGPTVADYDGDGLPELGVAGQAYLTIYDIDCSASPRPNGKCANTNGCDDATGTPGACPAGILWSRRTQDISSNITGSSVFDFEADGKAEVVYADECFVRVYDGSDGKVLFSQYRSSCTWYENPVVADTDGNFHADLVTPSNLACSTDGVSGINCTMLNADGVDTQFAGAGCQQNKDCPSNICDQGYCRCTTTADCCAAGDDATCLDQGVKCVTPPTGTPGTGNTCRANHPKGIQGIRVYQDATDKWVPSRTIWNQHAYHVTHVNDDGTIPKTSQWQKNWLDPNLNNFRQNVPGTANGQATPDLTAGISGFQCSGSGALLSAPICNRGAAPVAAGVKAGFYDGTTKVCEAATTKTLLPGECETVSCVWGTPPATATDLTVISDDGSKNNECKEGNNQGSVLGVKCKPTG